MRASLSVLLSVPRPWAVALGSVLIALLPGTATATGFETCEKSEIAEIEAAIDGAGALALRASLTVADTPTFTHWFGRYNDEHAEQVRATLKAVHQAITGQELRARCGNADDADCKDGTYAWVWRDEPYVISLCPNFFGLPAMFEGEPGDRFFDNGTREGTIIHEVSHFTVVADTDDNCYGRETCAGMARRDQASVLVNADSFQYYAEDIAYFVRHGSTWPVGRRGSR